MLDVRDLILEGNEHCVRSGAGGPELVETIGCGLFALTGSALPFLGGGVRFLQLTQPLDLRRYFGRAIRRRLLRLGGSLAAALQGGPQNQRKLDAADALAQLAEDSDLTLIHMALAFVIGHPAVTAAIIGPRTMEQLESQLGALDVQLDSALLDRIDGIVPPGTNFNSADRGWVPPTIEESALRRR